MSEVPLYCADPARVASEPARNVERAVMSENANKQANPAPSPRCQGLQILTDFPERERLITSPALGARSNRLFQVVDLYWLSPESGDLRYKSMKFWRRSLAMGVRERSFGGATSARSGDNLSASTSARRGDNLTRFKEVYLKAKASIWPRLSGLDSLIRSTAGRSVKYRLTFQRGKGS